MNVPSFYDQGLSIIPLLPNAKAPTHRRWTEFQHRIASEDEILAWPEGNIGIVAGDVSGNLLIDDLDDPDFISWVRVQPVYQKLPWLVETGSHKLHIYMRTESDDLHGENIDIEGVHFGEIRGNGQYVVAPPSRVDDPEHDPDHDQPYQFIRAERIPVLKDARAFFHSLVNAYLNRQPESQPQVDSRAILAPLIGDAADALTARVEAAYDLSKEMKRSILGGVEPGKGIWKNFPSYSQIDYAIVENLIRCRFTDEEVERIFATFPVGRMCYQNTDRAGSFGSKYIGLTLIAAHKKLNAITVAAEEARGEDFTITKVTKKLYDEPVYEITVEGPDGLPTVMFECAGTDIISEARFRAKLFVALNYIPHFKARGKDYEKFADAIGRLAKMEVMPEAAKQSGFLRAFIVDQIRRNILADKPINENQMDLSYTDRQNGHLYVRGTRLMHRVQLGPKPTPKTQEVWELLRAMGGKEVTVKYEETGTTEELWSLPSSILKRRTD